MGGKRAALARARRARRARTPISMKKAFWKRYERENHVAKSQGIYLESGLIEA